MHHVPNDKRALRSADLIWEGLEGCLEEKELGRVRIADISERSHVSRATFYRLFDSVEDVLAYRCDRVFEAVASEAGSIPSSAQLFLFFIERWLEERALLRAIAENNMTGLIYDAHMRNKDLVRRVYVKDVRVTDVEADYLVSILTSILPAAIRVWYEHGQRESPEEVYRIGRKCAGLIAIALNE